MLPQLQLRHLTCSLRTNEIGRLIFVFLTAQVTPRAGSGEHPNSPRVLDAATPPGPASPPGSVRASHYARTDLAARARSD